jgi:hypothetical protein
MIAKTSYVSRAERAQQRWMPLNEAISHIRRVDGCDEALAFDQLRRALADGAVDARWGRSKLSSTFFEIKPTGRMRLSTFWQTVPIDSEGGFIPGVYPEDLPDADPEIEDSSPKQYLPRHSYLFLLRDQIFQLWKDQDLGSAAERQPVASDEDQIQAISGILQEVEDGKIKRPDMNMLHRLVEARVAPERAPKKPLLVLYRKHFPSKQIHIGRPKTK